MGNIWDRQNKRDEIWRLLESGQNLALFAPRRLGKTWLMQQLLLSDAEEKNWQAIYCDLQAESDCQGAVLEIIRNIQALNTTEDNLLIRTRAKFTDITDGKISSFKDLLAKTDWETLLRTVLSTLESQDKPSVIMLDEVTVCVTHIIAIDEVEGRRFLNTLRKIRNEYKNIKWILTGSIGIDYLVDQYQMSGAVNDLEPLELNPFTQATAQAFTDYFCQTSSVKKEFLLDDLGHIRLQQRLGWLSPFYIERLCRRIDPTGTSNKGTSNKGAAMATEADIDKACESLLSHPHNRAFKNWVDHIDRNISDDHQAVSKAILDFLCQSIDAVSKDSIRHRLEPGFESRQINQALQILVNDGFLVESKSQHFRFALPLLASYWEKYLLS